MLREYTPPFMGGDARVIWFRLNDLYNIRSRPLPTMLVPLLTALHSVQRSKQAERRRRSGGYHSQRGVSGVRYTAHGTRCQFARLQ